METNPNTKTDTAPDYALKESDYRMFTPILDAVIDEGRREGLSSMALVPVAEMFWLRIQQHNASHEDSSDLRKVS